MKDPIDSNPSSEVNRRFRWAVVALLVQLAAAGGLSALGLDTLGIALFVATPLTVGIIAGFISSWRQMWQLLAVLLAVPSLVLLFVGIEGLLCVALAAPLLGAVMLLGYGIGQLLQRFRKTDDARDFHAALWLPAAVFLVTSAVEQFLGIEFLPNQTTSSIQLKEAPEKVFAAIVHVDSVLAEPHWLHVLGLPRPLASHLDTLAVGAHRKCYLSDGLIDERILSFNTPHSISMDMGGATMGRAWLRLMEDEYHLEASIDGGTRITHTTQFASNLRPRAYWAAVERYTVRAQHQVVFDNLLLDLKP